MSTQVRYRYAAVLVAGPCGVNRVTLVRTARAVPAPPAARDALPLHIPFVPPPPPVLPSWWLARPAERPTQPAPAEPAPAPAPAGRPPAEVPAALVNWTPPDGPALKALRTRTGLSQRDAAAVAYVARGIVCDIEHGRRFVGKGISVTMLHQYVTTLEQLEPAVVPDGH